MIFTDGAIARMKTAPQTESLAYRVAAITLVQPPGHNVPWLGAQRKAWTNYLDAAFRCRLFADPHGKDLTRQLTSVDDDQFRSAMAECQAAWYLSMKLGLKVSAKPPGEGNKVLDLLARLPDGNDVHVEVKSPLREGIADGVARELDDSDILEDRLADASRKFKKRTSNLVMLVGRLTLGVHARRFFLKAFYASEKMVIPILANGTTGPARIEYDLTGLFLKVWPGEEGPRHTRVGGVLFVQDDISSPVSTESQCVYRVDNNALMMHNPRALQPLPEEPWGDCPQLVLRDDVMEWTDGHVVGGPTAS